ncbi:MAG: hypothetical protein HRU15_12485 [Planctomycetes bacterium]|nr:hypothetical protein [Planctomycetota bacterium]
MQKMAWFYTRCEIPEDWECTCYSIEAKDGYLQFHTRNGLEATYHWKILKHVPDELRMVNEIHRRHLERTEHPSAATFTDLQHCKVNDFLFAWDPESKIAHGSYFLKEFKVHLHWIFNGWTEEKAKEKWYPLMKSHVNNTEDTIHWSLFNIHIKLPDTYVPMEIEAVPANVSLIFEGPKHMHIHVRRFGMPEIMLDGQTLFGFYGKYQKKCGRRIVGRNDMEIFKHPGVRLEVEQRGEYRMEKLSGKWWKGQAFLWHDTKEKRMYAFDQIGPKKAQRLEISDVISS